MKRSVKRLLCVSNQRVIWVFISLALLYGCKEEVKIPVITTAVLSHVAITTATCGGLITSDGGANITACGVCWSIGETPSIADNKSTDSLVNNRFTSYITDLLPNTTYYVLAYATNSAGTGYGIPVSFTTGGVIDIDENAYHTIVIGTQEWMVENLKTRHYRDGSDIPEVIDNVEWSNLTTGAYCNYLNDTMNASTYGLLYNFYAVTNIKGICPSGWRIPDETDYNTLIAFLGGKGIAGGKLKESGTTYWFSPNVGATNESGFSALPGGMRNLDGTYFSIGASSNWWSSTEFQMDFAKGLYLDYINEACGFGEVDKSNGFYIRCLKN